MDQHRQQELSQQRDNSTTGGVDNKGTGYGYDSGVRDRGYDNQYAFDTNHRETDKKNQYEMNKTKPTGYQIKHDDNKPWYLR